MAGVYENPPDFATSFYLLLAERSTTESDGVQRRQLRK